MQNTHFYYRFLDLMAVSTGSFFVPTLDIDLVWHTHQLMAPQYTQDCKKFIGRFLDQYVLVSQWFSYFAT